MLTTFSIITILAAGAITLPLWRQWRIVRRTPEVVTSNESDFVAALERRLDQFYLDFAYFFSHLGHYLYYYTLVLMRHLLGWSRYLIYKIEKRFSRLIDSVRGRGVINHKGSVSLFLAKLKINK